MLFVPFLCIMSASLTAQPLRTVPEVDLDRYAGMWYEIASFPQRFTKGCHGTTAMYTTTSKGCVIVNNRCRRGSLSGKESGISGKAFVVPNSGNAKLKVQFFWPLKG